jgi:hypothetical protein
MASYKRKKERNNDRGRRERRGEKKRDDKPKQITIWSKLFFQSDFNKSFC